MFRKQKSISPYFRMPNPTNPITGDAHYLYPPMKQYTRFTLTEALTTADEVKDAEIVDSDQWGPAPIYHCPQVKIHVHNQLTKEAGVYVFSGAVGDVGIALWDQNMEWRIIAMLMGGLRGGCLDENHPGRGVSFDIHLGTWNSATTTPMWEYDLTTTVKAIDWRFGVPYPDAGATGLFEQRPSDEYGTIFETVSLDCSTPGECGA